MILSFLRGSSENLSGFEPGGLPCHAPLNSEAKSKTPATGRNVSCGPNTVGVTYRKGPNESLNVLGGDFRPLFTAPEMPGRSPFLTASSTRRLKITFSTALPVPTTASLPVVRLRFSGIHRRQPFFRQAKAPSPADGGASTGLLDPADSSNLPLRALGVFARAFLSAPPRPCVKSLPSFPLRARRALARGLLSPAPLAI